MNATDNIGRLILVSNRGSYILHDTPEGIKGRGTVSGLVSALEPIIKETGGVWIAWGGRQCEETVRDGQNQPGLLVTNGCQEPRAGERIHVPFDNPRYYLREVLLTQGEVEGFYYGLANDCLWPLCHNFLEKTSYRSEDWVKYVEVNRKFAKTVMEEVQAGDLVWIQDYHLTLVPQWVRRWRPTARIAMFWHIPFPPLEVFSTLPWGRQILLGMLGCDLVAFHLESYKENFLKCVSHYFGIDTQDSFLSWGSHQVSVEALPIGIDFQGYQQMAASPQIRQRAMALREKINSKYILFGIDRLDYTKGIVERLRALEIFLERYPNYQDSITMLQVAVPSRQDVPAYKQLKQQVEEAVGRINGRFSSQWNTPIRYHYGSLSNEDLVAHYLACDMALVTPLRDGLNLVAKEFIASRVDGKGVLLLSPFAGAAAELTEALLVNPYAPGEIAAAIKRGLEMSDAEQAKRIDLLQKRLKSKDIHWWWQQMRIKMPVPAKKERIHSHKLLEFEQAKGRKSGSNIS